jgi:hypothetical protein
LKYNRLNLRQNSQEFEKPLQHRGAIFLPSTFSLRAFGTERDRGSRLGHYQEAEKLAKLLAEFLG